ncbi:MFS transporter [Pelomyxa schiedti]|nr:MFS transporter [Pelomyxa schiedti]
MDGDNGRSPVANSGVPTTTTTTTRMSEMEVGLVSNDNDNGNDREMDRERDTSNGITSSSSTDVVNEHEPAALWAVVVFIWINSAGSALLGVTVYFIAEEVYLFSALELYILGIGIGVATMLSPPFGNWVLKRLKPYSFSARKMFFIVEILCGILVTVPLLSDKIFGEEKAHKYGIPLYVTAILYMFFITLLWPAGESYTSSRNKPLEWSVGVYNICWACAVLIVLPLSPLVAKFALQTLCGLIIIHILSPILLLWFTANPVPRNTVTQHKKMVIPIASIWCNTIYSFQVPVMTFITCSLSPYLPVILTDIGVDQKYHTLVGSTWMFMRMVSFTAMFFTKLWHGTLITPVTSAAMVVGGYILCFLSMIIFTDKITGGTIFLTLGLIFFGLAFGVIFNAGLLYNFEVGSVDVSSSTLFEFFLGLGNVGGPVLGVIVYLMNKYGVISDSLSPILLLVSVSVISIVLIISGFIRAFQKTYIRSVTRVDSKPQHIEGPLADTLHDPLL